MSTPTDPAAPLTPQRFTRILLTGAAGNLGRVLRPRLKRYCDILRVSDIGEMGAAAAGEEVQPAPLEDKARVHALVEGVEAIVHLGGVSVEHPFETVLPANIVGVYNLYEAARRHGVRRVVFASSHHATGFYRQDETVDAKSPFRPDSYYGLSKAFGENLAQFYFDRYGLETVSLRIGSSWPKPVDRRMLCSWLSFDDLERLVVASLAAPIVGHTVVYGMSDNLRTWWDNRYASHLGFRPQDSSEPFRAELEARERTDPTQPVTRYQGGVFTAMGPFE